MREVLEALKYPDQISLRRVFHHVGMGVRNWRQMYCMMLVEGVYRYLDCLSAHLLVCNLGGAGRAIYTAQH